MEGDGYVHVIMLSLMKPKWADTSDFCGFSGTLEICKLEPTARDTDLLAHIIAIASIARTVMRTIFKGREGSSFGI